MTMSFTLAKKGEGLCDAFLRRKDSLYFNRGLIIASLLPYGG